MTQNLDHGAPSTGAPTGVPPVVLGPEPTHAERARTLVAGPTAATLATIGREPAGTPFASIAPFGLDAAGRPVLCISELAEHTQNLRLDGRCSLLLVEASAPGGDVLAAGRVTLVGSASVVPEAETAEARAAHLAGNPYASYFIDYTDFALWRIEIEQIRYVGGYGRMSWIDAADWATATPDPTAEFAAGVVEHLNDDHADAMVLIAQVTGGRTDATEALVVGVDRYGLELVVTSPGGKGRVRVGFDEPVTTPDTIRAATVALVKAARG